MTVHVRRHLRRKWFHGAPPQSVKRIQKIGKILPGQVTRFHQDVPRADAVYITTDLQTAQFYATESRRDRTGRYRQIPGEVFEVTVDETCLIPDEDAVFAFLTQDKHTILGRKVDKAWVQYRRTDRKSAIETLEYLLNIHNEDPQATELAEQMKGLAMFVARNDPALAKELIGRSGLAAHLGPVMIRRNL